MMKIILLCIFSVMTLLTPALSVADGSVWKWQQSHCQTCAISYNTTVSALKTAKVQAFMRAIEDSKFEITALYKSDPQEYNLLAHMAIGILGRESRFFESWRYYTKEELQWLVSVIKLARAMTADSIQIPANSRGPTQIKDVPRLIAEHYAITPDNLYIPENAARATMGYLIEALRELKQRAQNNQWEFVTKDTYVDYLPYIYFGSVGKLKARTATPEKNLYVQTMKKYMTWVSIIEYPPVDIQP